MTDHIWLALAIYGVAILLGVINGLIYVAVTGERRKPYQRPGVAIALSVPWTILQLLIASWLIGQFA